jgi:hypothetical protein
MPFEVRLEWPQAIYAVADRTTRTLLGLQNVASSAVARRLLAAAPLDPMRLLTLSNPTG